MQESYWWLSFCDPNRPEGSQFLGVSIVKAPSIELAITASHIHECNPGGEVAFYSFDQTECPVPVNQLLNRLMDKATLAETGLL